MKRFTALLLVLLTLFACYLWLNGFIDGFTASKEVGPDSFDDPSIWKYWTDSKIAQKSTFSFQGFDFDSMFETGNLKNVVQLSPNKFVLTIACDLEGTEFETQKNTGHFHFRLNRTSNEHEFVELTIFNLEKNQKRNVLHGWSPVYRSYSRNTQKEWENIPLGIRDVKIKSTSIQFAFIFKFHKDDSSIRFASSIPYGFSRNLKYISKIEKSSNLALHNYYFRRGILTYSLQKNPVDYFVLTDNSTTGEFETFRSIKSQIVFPDLNSSNIHHAFGARKVIIISARIHPAEAPASHMLEGFLDSLLEKKREILQDAVFFVIPFLNPDGVLSGYYRSDAKGRDLNRVYNQDDPSGLPSNHALKEIVQYYLKEGRLAMTIDLHAHSLYDGLFIYGNSGSEISDTKEVKLFSKYLEKYCEHFMMTNSEFTPEADEPQDKAGIGRFFFRKATNLKHIYTIESSYFRGKVTDESKFVPLNRKDFHEMGKCILRSLETIWPEIRSADPHFRAKAKTHFSGEL